MWMFRVFGSRSPLHAVDHRLPGRMTCTLHLTPLKNYPLFACSCSTTVFRRVLVDEKDEPPSLRGKFQRLPRLQEWLFDGFCIAFGRFLWKRLRLFVPFLPGLIGRPLVPLHTLCYRGLRYGSSSSTALPTASLQMRLEGKRRQSLGFFKDTQAGRGGMRGSSDNQYPDRTRRNKFTAHNSVQFGVRYSNLLWLG